MGNAEEAVASARTIAKEGCEEYGVSVAVAVAVSQPASRRAEAGGRRQSVISDVPSLGHWGSVLLPRSVTRSFGAGYTSAPEAEQRSTAS